MTKGEYKTKTDFIDKDLWGCIMQCLTPSNALCCELALQTGWRIDDCLALTAEALEKAKEKGSTTITITEQKTQKKSRKRLTKALFDTLYAQKGAVFVFEGRDNICNHRTRQAVWTDLKRARKALRLKQNISPHSTRKGYAVDMLQSGKGLDKVQKALNHSHESDTLIYALADTYTALKLRSAAKGASRADKR